MDLSYYIDQIKFQLTGNVLVSELEDDDYKKVVNYSLQELNRYYDATKLIEVENPGSCIDLKKIEDDNSISINYVAQVYRTKPNGTSSTSSGTDPMLISQWNMANNYYNYGANRWIMNYAAYNTTNQISNTLSTDLDFKEDKHGKKLYVNFTNGSSNNITIEYVPHLKEVDEIVGDYWVNVLLELSLAYSKILLGRIRTRYTQTNALWSQDGEKMLQEGTDELKALKDRLKAQANFTYPLD